jgi:hypothetical protein
VSRVSDATLDASPTVAASAQMYAALEARALGAQQMEGVVLRYGFFSGPNTWYHPAADGELGTNLRSAVSTR